MSKSPVTINTSPALHRKTLSEALDGRESTWYPGWFYVAPDLLPGENVTPTETEVWLTYRFGITSDSPVYRITFGLGADIVPANPFDQAPGGTVAFNVMFCWYTQGWLVKDYGEPEMKPLLGSEYDEEFDPALWGKESE